MCRSFISCRREWLPLSLIFFFFKSDNLVPAGCPVPQGLLFLQLLFSGCWSTVCPRLWGSRSSHFCLLGFPFGDGPVTWHESESRPTGDLIIAVWPVPGIGGHKAQTTQRENAAVCSPRQRAWGADGKAKSLPKYFLTFAGFEALDMPVWSLPLWRWLGASWGGADLELL